MIMKKTLIMVLAALVCAGTQARSKKRDKKKAKKEFVNPIQPVAADSLSYALGVVQSASLVQYLQQREGVDTALIDVAFAGVNSNLPEEEVKRVLAFAAGLKIQQMNQQMLPGLNRDLTGKEDTTYVQLPLMNQGLHDAAKGNLSMMSAEQAQAIVQRQQEHLMGNLRIEGERFLEQNKDAEGVVTLPSGLQYKILTQGTGAVAADSSMVEVHYEGRLLNGTVFDSSYQRGKTASFKPTQVIKGWREALCLMPEGSTWELYVPQELGYGETGTRNIPPFSTLIFKVQVIKVK
jgi:FKBP-type peptidyl-prolyl cis-trans isomerase FklB